MEFHCNWQNTTETKLRGFNFKLLHRRPFTMKKLCRYGLTSKSQTLFTTPSFHVITLQNFIKKLFIVLMQNMHALPFHRTGKIYSE